MNKLYMGLLAAIFAMATWGCGQSNDAGTSESSNSRDAASSSQQDAGVEEMVEEPIEVVITEDENLTQLKDGHISLTIDRETGTFDIAIDEHTYFKDATSAIELGTVSITELESTLHPASGLGDTPRTVEITEGDEGTVVELKHPDFPWGELKTIFEILPQHGGITVRAELTSSGVENLVSLIPMFIGPQQDIADAGLTLQSAPKDLLILQNGADIGIDYYVDLIPGDTPYRRGFMDTVLENLPSSASNWNALIYDRAESEGLMLGYLTFERVVPEVVIGYDEALDKEGFSHFHARCSYVVARNEADGNVVASETFWLDRFEGRPQSALEDYAQMLVEHHPPPAYKGEKAGWDPWYVYSDNIDEEIIMTNLEGLVENFADYGLTTLQVDLGWEMDWGVWSNTPEGFPSGMDTLAANIASAGLEPEIWMSSFNAMTDTPLLTEHPEWIAEIEPIMHVLLQPGSIPLDLTRDDVIDFVFETGEWLSSWGYIACKFDFAYYWMFATSLQNPDTTVIESYRRGMEAFRQGFGEEHYLINILLMGTNYGEVDSMRVGIDSRACWGEEEGEDCPAAYTTTGYSGEGLRYALKTLARRYYYNNVMWKNHPDQIFFRDYPSFEAQRAWGTAVALGGALVSLGEEVSSMTEEEIDTFRRFLPTMDYTGVPQDLFEREYPEVWLTNLEGKELGGAALGLYSWGTNKDLTQNPYGDIPEETRQHEVSLADLGLSGAYHAFEYWTDTDLGVIDDKIMLDVPARDSRVVILRPHQDRPYILQSNRHVSQGATDIEDALWDAETKTLSWTQKVVKGFDHRVRIDGSGFSTTPSLTVDGQASGSLEAFGDLWSIDINALENGSIKLHLAF